MEKLAAYMVKHMDYGISDSSTYASCIGSPLSYKAGGYQALLYLGGEVNEENYGLFTIDTGSSNFIVNSYDCTEDICKQYKQYSEPKSKPLYTDKKIFYADGSGYTFDVFSTQVVVPGSSNYIVVDTDVGYVTGARPNPLSGKADNFDNAKEGIIGLGFSEISEPYGLQNLVDVLYSQGLTESKAFSICLDSNSNSNYVNSYINWGGKVPEDVIKYVPVNTQCGDWAITVESIAVSQKSIIPNPNPYQFTFTEKTSNYVPGSAKACIAGLIVDTGSSIFTLDSPNFSNFYDIVVAYYTAIDKNLKSTIEEIARAKSSKSSKSSFDIKVSKKVYNQIQKYLPYISIELSNSVKFQGRLSIEDWPMYSKYVILGQPVLRGHYVVFDGSDYTLGIAPNTDMCGGIKCPSQQSFPQYVQDDINNSASKLMSSFLLSTIMAILASIM